MCAQAQPAEPCQVFHTALFTTIIQSPAFGFWLISFPVYITFLFTLLQIKKSRFGDETCEKLRDMLTEITMQTGAIKPNSFVLSQSTLQFASNPIWCSAIKPTDLRSQKCVYTVHATS